LREGTYALQLVAAGDRRPVLPTEWLCVRETSRVVSLPTLSLAQSLRSVSLTVTDAMGEPLPAARVFWIDPLGAASEPSECRSGGSRLVSFARSHVAVAVAGHQAQVHPIEGLPQQIRLRRALRCELDLGDAATSVVSLVAEPSGAFDPIRFGTVHGSIAGQVLVGELPGAGTYRVHVGRRSAGFPVRHDGERLRLVGTGDELEVVR